MEEYQQKEIELNRKLKGKDEQIQEWKIKYIRSQGWNLDGLSVQELIQLQKESVERTERINEALFRLLESTLSKQQSANECAVCMDNPIDIVCIPCGHLILCSSCANRIQQAEKRCPTCREPVTKFQKVWRK